MLVLSSGLDLRVWNTTALLERNETSTNEGKVKVEWSTVRNCGKPNPGAVIILWWGWDGWKLELELQLKLELGGALKGEQGRSFPAVQA